ncbi:Fc.00g107220.m01.CDS01 [Cosmosporella sp. VM-42]
MIPTSTTPAANDAIQTSKNTGTMDNDKIFAPAAHDDAMSEKMVGETSEFEKRKTLAGDRKFHRLGWKRLTIMLIVQAIALGALSLPSAFATLGMVPAVICSVGIGLVAIYTAYIVGKVKVTFPQISHYPDVGRLMFGRVGYEIIYAMLVVQLTFLTASHCLTGTIAFVNITGATGICSLVFGVVSAVLLLLLAVPPSFAEFSILGYIDFASIMAAIGITIIATGVKTNSGADVDWSAWPQEGTSFAKAFIAICNIMFAYSFTLSQFSFMDEMHTPTDYMKSIWTLGGIEIVIYTLTGALVYAFVGVDVKSPALLSAGTLLSKVAFGVALPVIFISGSINTTVAARVIHGRMYKNSVTRYVNTTKGWVTWLALISVITWIGFVIAEAIPFFGDLVAITSSLLNSGFTLYFPALMWFLLIRKGSWNSKENLALGLVNGGIFLMGAVLLVGGTYAAVQDIIDQYRLGVVRGAFTCAPLG